MERRYEYNYLDIDAYVGRANQMRSDALGQMLAAGWLVCKRLTLQLLARKSAGSQEVKPSGSHGMAY